jgi:hypothetical protein
MLLYRIFQTIRSMLMSLMTECFKLELMVEKAKSVMNKESILTNKNGAASKEVFNYQKKLIQNVFIIYI